MSAASRASVSASARMRRASIAGRAAEVDEAADHRADDDKNDEREQVLALHDREGVDRFGEVPVSEQEARESGHGEPGQDPADGTDRDDEREVEEQHRLEPNVGAHLRTRRTVSSGNPITAGVTSRRLGGGGAAANAKGSRAGATGVTGAPYPTASCEMTWRSIGSRECGRRG